MLACYVSGHGYGHATRVGEVLREVRRREPSLPIAVVTSGPEQLYRRAIAGSVRRSVLKPATSVSPRKARSSSTRTGTVEAWRRFQAGYDDRVGREARWLRESMARVVLGDIPPLAFDAAAEAGVESIALANFSWDWIYRHLAARQPALHEAADHAARGLRALRAAARAAFRRRLVRVSAPRPHSARRAPAAHRPCGGTPATEG